MQTKEQIAAGLEAAFEEVARFLEAQDPTAWESAPPGKWSPGQQADHLVRASQPVNTALRLPGFVLGLIFGRADRPSTSYDEVVARYRGVLDEGAKASGRYVPPAVPAAKKAGTIAALRREKARLIAGVRSHPDAYLDQYVVPHPLIGKMTLREILWFTIYHTQHHLASLRAPQG